MLVEECPQTKWFESGAKNFPKQCKLSFDFCSVEKTVARSRRGGGRIFASTLDNSQANREYVAGKDTSWDLIKILIVPCCRINRSIASNWICEYWIVINWSSLRVDKLPHSNLDLDLWTKRERVTRISRMMSAVLYFSEFPPKRRKENVRQCRVIINGKRQS